LVAQRQSLVQLQVQIVGSVQYVSIKVRGRSQDMRVSRHTNPTAYLRAQKFNKHFVAWRATGHGSATCKVISGLAISTSGLHPAGVLLTQIHPAIADMTIKSCVASNGGCTAPVYSLQDCAFTAQGPGTSQYALFTASVEVGTCKTARPAV